MRALVTGGAGYIGSRLTSHLLACGFNVTVFDRLVYGGQALLPFVGNRSFRLVKGDVRNRAALEAVVRESDVVVHLAAIVGEPACDLDTVAAKEVNQDAAMAALDIAEALGSPVPPQPRHLGGAESWTFLREPSVHSFG